MCTSYHVFPEENIEMREIISETVRRFPSQLPQTGRVSPSQTAAVLMLDGPAPMRFGLGLKGRKGLLLNARSESAATSPLFAPMLQAQRCLVPANDFYEWDDRKKAYLFSLKNRGLLYFAGLYLQMKPLPHFVIITRDADSAVTPIHNRMPLILDSPEYREAWLRSPQLAQELLMLPGEAELISRPA